MQTQKNVRKSFVLRKGRITVAQRRALKSLKNKYTIPVGKKRLDLAEAFINKEIPTEKETNSKTTLIKLEPLIIEK